MKKDNNAHGKTNDCGYLFSFKLLGSDQKYIKGVKHREILTMGCMRLIQLRKSEITALNK